MTIYEEFMRELFGEEEALREPVFCGKYMAAKLDDQIIIKVALISSRNNNRYDGLQCTILNRYGVIDKAAFLFSDMLMTTPTIRDTDGKSELYSKFGVEDFDRIRDITLGYITKFYDENHDRR